MLLNHWSQHYNGWCQLRHFIKQWYQDSSSFIFASSNGSGSTTGCTVIGCSMVLAGAMVPASMRTFAAVVVAAQLEERRKAPCGDCACPPASGED